MITLDTKVGALLEAHPALVEVLRHRPLTFDPPWTPDRIHAGSGGDGGGRA